MSGVRLLAAAATFVASLVLLFPSDLVARRMLARATQPGWPVLGFSYARLRPGGIRLSEVTLRDDAGAQIVQADHVWLRPSIPGLLRDGHGLPWRIDVQACGGTADALVAGSGPTTAITVRWRDADLASCPPLAAAGAGVLEGRAHGAARFAIVPGTAPEGDGHLDVEAATWRGQGLAAAVGALHAATASLRWRLGDGRIIVEQLDVAGPEISIEGSGELRLADPWAESDLDLRLALAPATQAPQLLRLLLGVPAQGRRDILLAGTLARPRAVFQ